MLTNQELVRQSAGRSAGTTSATDDGTTPWYGRLLSKEFQFILDFIVLIGAFVLSYLLRFDFQIPPEQQQVAFRQLPYVVLIQLLALFACGVQSFIWRYISLGDLRAFGRAAIFAALPFVILRFALPASWSELRIPLSVIVMDAILGFGGLLGLRIVRRSFYERYEAQSRPSAGHQAPVLLIGAGRAGVMAAKEILGRGDVNLRVVGFVDDDKQKEGSQIQGVKVLGTTADLPRLVAKHGIDHVILTIADASRSTLRRIVETCEAIPVKVRIIPGLYEILQGDVAINRIRDIEIEDLLRRPPVQLEAGEIHRFLGGKVVMVTGAGGSIGAELARQVARFNPARLVLAERAEFALFEVERSLRGSFPHLAIVPRVADVGDEPRMRALFAEDRPQVVLHAAAHKHVPLMEANPTEAVKNNSLATHTLGTLAGQAGVEAFVLISTDKAVRPASIMGASKRLGELVIQALDRRFATRFVAVRFGNVLGSTGSVVPIFREQIAAGGPVTVTHPEMQRYFMTIPEAAQLVLQAGAMGEGGEIFILDMGKPVRILDLARDMIVLSGLHPGEDIEIVFTGLRPGEKLAEELEHAGEAMEKTRHPEIYIGKLVPYPPEIVDGALAHLRKLCAEDQRPEIRRFLASFLPEAQLGPAGPLPAAGRPSSPRPFAAIP